jgi:peroxiredoxin
MFSKSRRIVLSALLLAVVAGSSLAHAQDARAPLPEFALDELNGGRVESASLVGNVVVISFWASWCGPCQQELAQLSTLTERYADQGLVVLAVATDGPDTLSDVRNMARRGRWVMPVLLDQAGTVKSLLNPRGAEPYTIFVDRSGRIVETHDGYAPGDEVGYEATIQTLLAEAAP